MKSHMERITNFQKVNNRRVRSHPPTYACAKGLKKQIKILSVSKKKDFHQTDCLMQSAGEDYCTRRKTQQDTEVVESKDDMSVTCTWRFWDSGDSIAVIDESSSSLGHFISHRWWLYGTVR